jgi:hypothetical protein
MIAAPILIDRSMTNYCAGVSGKVNRINPRCRQNKKRNVHLSPQSRTNICLWPASRPPLFLNGHYLLRLIIGDNVFCIFLYLKDEAFLKFLSKEDYLNRLL